ncbi:hypothetical protein LF887_24215 [Chryseobacterium sp. MEBOG06]|uniref:hypothetical protein n=1 Tax=Chryseobacterium sp. MEBOG06 TaxID=2879938 RepID=UPI001F15C59F|nr:hypothetical protein [Chryseobacterium sp. MEBOG06]UKB84065.1 hypothetical protein LF887_24215 [Chryseobacterium sp. MEBOG06]
MDFKRIKLLILLVVFGNLFYSQKLKISASSPATGIFDVILTNTTNHEIKIVIDTTGINFACKKEDIYNNNYLRIALCTTIPKNTDFPTGIEFNQHEPDNKYGGYLSPKEYIEASKILLKPGEQKKIGFNIFKQKDIFSKLDKKPTLLKSRMILFKNDLIDETFISNTFTAKMPLKKW